MGANYTFYVKTIDTHACAFLTFNILYIGTVCILDFFPSLIHIQTGF